MSITERCANFTQLRMQLDNVKTAVWHSTPNLLIDLLDSRLLELILINNRNFRYFCRMPVNLNVGMSCKWKSEYPNDQAALLVDYAENETNSHALGDEMGS
ncbi:hypothetical protein DPMN_164340 [Dreissena polymorpha]|uniref:Uncharacterized protein n=1 Tax=Dreissena polymorpha TaxID=45954 RepID=A0A9D4ESS3_DREPO|nr:hypothetical protein DPMN_164340 [Dreissena polymorpha]